MFYVIVGNTFTKKLPVTDGFRVGPKRSDPYLFLLNN